MFEDWRADNYYWHNKGSNKGLPTNNPIVFKNYFHGKIKKGEIYNVWQKHVYFQIRNVEKIIDSNEKIIEQEPIPAPCIVHYIGNNINFDPPPHGNYKNKDIRNNLPGHTQTAKSVINNITSELKTKN